MNTMSAAVLSVACPVVQEVRGIISNVCEYWSLQRRVSNLTAQLSSTQLKDRQLAKGESRVLITDLKARVCQHEKNAEKPFVTTSTFVSIVAPTLFVGIVSSGMNCVPAAGVALASLLSTSLIHVSYKLREIGVARTEKKMIVQLNKAVEEQTPTGRAKRWFIAHFKPDS